MNKFKVLYLLLFSLGVIYAEGCHTVDNYSDTPQNIVSGKSEIKRNGECILEKILLNSGVTKYFEGYNTVFVNCSNDSCATLVFRNIEPVWDTIPKTDSTPMKLIYKKPSTDSIKVADIKTMFYKREYSDTGSLVFIAGVILIVPVLYLIASALSPRVD